MGELDEMLNGSDEFVSAVVRRVKERLEAGGKPKLKLNRSDINTTFTIIAPEEENHQALDDIEWDDGTNAELVELGIKAEDQSHEANRFALMLRSALRKVERKYGDGYLNTVLVNLLDDSDLCKTGEIAEMRKYVRVYPAEPSKSYNECRESIALEIGARARELRQHLKYSQEEAKSIMTRALAIYLDERFSISARREFGMLE